MAALKRRSPNLSYRRKNIGVSEVSPASSPACIPIYPTMPAHGRIKCWRANWWHWFCIYRLIMTEDIWVWEYGCRPPHRIFAALLRQISYLPHFRTLAAPGLSHPPRRISRGRRKICCDPPFPKLLRVAPFKSEFALVWDTSPISPLVACTTSYDWGPTPTSSTASPLRRSMPD
jgi:hypothetical protein